MSNDVFMYGRINTAANVLLKEVRSGVGEGKEESVFSGALFAMMHASKASHGDETDFVGSICAVLVRDAMERGLTRETALDHVAKRMRDHWEATIQAVTKVRQETQN